MEYRELREYIISKMRPDKAHGEEKNYQPVVIRFLNQSSNGAGQSGEIITELQKENPNRVITSGTLTTVTKTLIRNKVIKKIGKSFELLDFNSYKVGEKTEITKRCEDRINEPDSEFVIVEDRSELERAHKVLINSLDEITTKSQTMKVNTPGGGSTHKVNWIESLGIWWLSDIKNTGISYWDVFGTDEPEWSKQYAPEIKVELNAPTKGRNKRTKAQFVKDENGDVYLCHSGEVNVQGGADEPFWKVYSGPATWIEPEFGDGSFGEYLLISKLSDLESPEKIAEYVNAVNNYKVSQKENKEKNKGTLFEAGHRLFLLEISQKGDKTPFENFDHAEFRQREVDWKLEAAEKSKNLLSLDKWDEWKSNPEKIFTAVREASSSKINKNLVWGRPPNTDVNYFDGVEDKIKKEFGSHLFNFFKGKGTIEERYDKFLVFLDKTHGRNGKSNFKNPRLLSYLLFLLDSQKYFPIHPTKFNNLVAFFGKSVVKEDSWKKYDSYLKLASELKLKLDDLYSADLSAVEIQSYMWELAGAVSKNFFMIRAGQDGEDWENQKNERVIGIHYVTVDLDEYLNKDGKTISKSKLKSKWQEILESESPEPRSKKQMDMWMGQLDRFHKIKKDDKIIAIGKNSELLGVGNATGSYKFRADIGVNCHTVPVDWYDTDAREIPMQSMNITVKDLTAREYIDLMASEGNKEMALSLTIYFLRKNDFDLPINSKEEEKEIFDLLEKTIFKFEGDPTIISEVKGFLERRVI